MEGTGNQGTVKGSCNDVCKGVRSIVEGEKGTLNGKEYTAQEDANSKCCSKNAILITNNQYLCK